MESTADNLFGVNIRVYQNAYPNSEIMEAYTWKDLPFEVRTKWNWYFKYRAALLQIKYPKSRVDFIQFKYVPETRSQKEISAKRIKNLLIAKKRKVTQLNNIINQKTSNWTELFPIEQHPQYIKTIEKLNYVLKQRDQYQEQYDSLLK